MLALLPIKSLSDAKRRLAALLSAEERQRLCAAMAGDVLAMLSQHPAIDRVVVCSSDPALQALAQLHGAEFLSEDELASLGDAPRSEREKGLNGVVNAAARRFSGEGVAELLVVHADLPLLRAQDIDALLRAHRQAQEASPLPVITINPDRHGTGSNLLLWNPAANVAGQRFETAYGEGSFARHGGIAESLHMRLNVCVTAGGGLDIDEPDDLAELIARIEPGGAPLTDAFLTESGLPERMHCACARDAGAMNNNAVHA